MKEDSVSKIEEEFTETFQALKRQVDALVFQVDNIEKSGKLKILIKRLFFGYKPI